MPDYRLDNKEWGKLVHESLVPGTITCCSCGTPLVINIKCNQDAEVQTIAQILVKKLAMFASENLIKLTPLEEDEEHVRGYEHFEDYRGRIVHRNRRE